VREGLDEDSHVWLCAMLCVDDAVGGRNTADVARRTAARPCAAPQVVHV